MVGVFTTRSPPKPRLALVFMDERFGDGWVEGGRWCRIWVGG